MEMNTVNWTDQKLNGRLWCSRSEDGRWYIEHLDQPGTPWAIYYCDPASGDYICDAAWLGTLKEAKACVETGDVVRLIIAKLEERVTRAARMQAVSGEAERRASDTHESARSALAGAVADLLMRQTAE